MGSKSSKTQTLQNNIKDEKGEQTDNLKIELYPDKKPRYEFKRSPLKNLITQETLGFSFNKNDSLAYIHSKTPFLNGMYLAHCNHYPIRIKPDIIWLLIVQAFSNHVNANAESLRHYFVDFTGKKTLSVKYPLNSIEQVDKKVLENFSEQINTQMKKFLGDELLETLTPNFSTTDYDSTIIYKISIMSAFKKYFDYEMCLCGCGIPYIILEGTADDYKKIISKAKKLKKYDFAWYINRIIPHIQKMVDAKNGKTDTNYFKNMVQDDSITEYVSGLSGMGGGDEQFPLLKGWILSFFAYYSDVRGIKKTVPRFEKDHIKVKDFNKLASQMLIVPFLIKDEVHNKEYKMKYNVGFIGCDQNNNNEVFPVIGWIVSPSTEEDEDSIL